MSPSVVRRLIRNPQGQLEEVGLVEAPAAPAGEDGFVGDQPAGVVEPSGRMSPRFRAYRPQIAPPPVSGQYRANPRYVALTDVAPASRSRAIQNYRAWQDRHSEATNRVSAWLAGQGLLGPEVAAAYRAVDRADEVRAQGRQAVAAAQALEVAVEAQLAAGIAACLEGKGSLPSGAELVAAQAGVTAAELVAAQVEAACRQARQRLGQARSRIDWPAALARTEALDTPDAKTAATWLRAKISPPVGPTEDPLGWI